MNPLSGIGYFLAGLRLLFSPGIKRFVIVPLAINSVLFIVAIWFVFSQIAGWSDALLSHLPDWLQWLSWLFYLVFGLLCLLVVFFSFSALANIVAAPFNDQLCIAVAKTLAGRDVFSGNAQPPFLQLIVPSMLNEARKLLYFAKWSIPYIVLLFIPGLNILGSVLWFFFTAWMLNLEYLEYPLSQHNPDFNWQRQQLRQRKMLSLSFGSVVSIATLIPGINFLVMPAAIAGATKIYLERYHHSEAVKVAR